MTTRTDPANAARFAARQTAVLEETRKQVDEVRRKALAAHAKILADRNAKVAEVNEALKVTMARVKAQHRLVAANFRQEAINRDVHVTVNRGLESLEELVRFLRKTNVSEKRLLEAIQDPVMSGTYFDRERRASVSGLVQSVQRQLVQQYEFLNVAAHELRTPIMPILANTELLYDKLGSDTKELDTIMRNGLRLQRLAENILSATKIESGTVNYRMARFDLNQLLGQAIKDLEYTFRNRNVRIVFVPETESLTVVGDQDKLGQVVGNILDNALKFTVEGRILVRSRSEGGLAEVRISDEGPGIDPQIYPMLFSKFVARSSKGTGLGLYISKSIIDAHGGTIWATNMEGPGNHGCMFTFVIPLERP
ncbi:MAG: HAMP domain-containing histidine kinase [Thaumarchaeota archaeon]|nr:HAMP domain-containing histidine kinase [Nitrososphaerota archaeon]